MELNSKEQKTYETITKVINGELTRKEAMFELHKSRQQIYNLIKVYNEQGKEGFIHKNKGGAMITFRTRNFGQLASNNV